MEAGQGNHQHLQNDNQTLEEGNVCGNTAQ